MYANIEAIEKLLPNLIIHFPNIKNAVMKHLWL